MGDLSEAVKQQYNMKKIDSVCLSLLMGDNVKMQILSRPQAPSWEVFNIQH